MTSTSTRESIISTAAALIFEQGFAATGISRILREAGTGSSSLYHFFDSKEDVLLAVLDSHRERLEQEIVGPTRDVDLDPLTRVFRILGFYGTFLKATECRLGCPIGNLAGEVTDTYPRVREKLDQIFAVWRQAVADNLRQLDAPVDGPDAETLACFVLTVMEGGVMQSRVARSLEPFEHSVACLGDYLGRLFPESGPMKE